MINSKNQLKFLPLFCLLFFLQYAFYFLVVGAAIWASSWAGQYSLLSLLLLSVSFGFWFLSI